MSKDDYSIHESSDGVNFQPATFPSRYLLRQSSADFFLEESTDGVNFQPAEFFNDEPRLSSFDGTGVAASIQSTSHLNESYSDGSARRRSLVEPRLSSLDGTGVAAAIQSSSHLKKSSFAGSARGRSTQRQSNRGRGRADSVAGRSSARRGRGRAKGYAINAAVGDDVTKQFATSENAVNDHYDAPSRLPTLPAGLRHQKSWIPLLDVEPSGFAFKDVAGNHFFKD
jgi:hypothetical protein